MPAQRKNECWMIPGRPGKIHPRGRGEPRICYLRFGDWEKSLHIPFTEEYKGQALKLLEEEQDRRLLMGAAHRFGFQIVPITQPAGNHSPVQAPLQVAVPQADHLPIDDLSASESQVASKGIMVSLQGLLKDYEDTLRNETKDIRKHTRSGLRFYVSQDFTWDMMNQRDCIVAERLIHQMLTVSHNSGKVVEQSRSQRYDYAAKAFDYIVNRKCLPSNPLRQIKRPTRPAHTSKPMWMEIEVEIILYWMEKLEKPAWHIAVVRLLALSAMRHIEVLKLLREDACKDYILTMSKKQKQQKEEEVMREIPVLEIPGMRETLDELLAIPPAPKRRKYLLPAKSIDPVRQSFNEAVKASGLMPNNRTLYCLRKTAVWYMEDELIWDRQDILDVAGHTEFVSDKYYRTSPKGASLELRIQRKHKQRSGRLSRTRMSDHSAVGIQAPIPQPVYQ